MSVVESVQINLWCHDVERCAAFFRALGMPERFRYPAEGVPHQVEVEAAGVRIGFSSATIGAELFGIATTTGGASEIVLWCDTVDELHAAALDAGGSAVVAPTDSADGRLHYSWVHDPEGHRVKFVEKRKAGPWPDSLSGAREPAGCRESGPMGHAVA